MFKQPPPRTSSLPSSSSGSVQLPHNSIGSLNSVGAAYGGTSRSTSLQKVPVSSSEKTEKAKNITKENTAKREQRRSSRENMSGASSYAFGSNVPATASTGAIARKLLTTTSNSSSSAASSKPPSGGVVGTYRGVPSPNTTNNFYMKQSTTSGQSSTTTTTSSSSTQKYSTSSKPRTSLTSSVTSSTRKTAGVVESEPSSTTTRTRKPSIFGSLKLSTGTPTSSRPSSASPSAPPTASTTGKKSEDDILNGGAATPHQKIATKRLSLKDAILDKLSPRSRGKKDFPSGSTSSPDVPGSVNGTGSVLDILQETSLVNGIEENIVAVSSPKANKKNPLIAGQSSPYLQHMRPTPMNSNPNSINSSARRMSGTTDHYYNPARGSGARNSVDDGCGRRNSGHTHVFVDRSHLVFESEGNGHSTRSSKVSVYTRRQSLHQEVDEILRMTVPKRSAALKYLFNKQPSTPRGLVGLTNLGNTCFMNSILQCIFATELLMGYFLSGDFTTELNLKSPMKGQLANSFTSVVEEALKPSSPSTSRCLNPSRFKRQIDNWAPQFAGYNQQDAQEFLRFMLDGLHEDLNRVTVRPRFTYKDIDVDKLSDVDKARFSWHRYHASNCSFVFDLFGGQLQSTVTCHSCSHPSTTFDTFWDLSLPIPKTSNGSDAAPVSKCTLTDCLLEFAAKEVLGELYRCDNCKSRVTASKRLQIYKCPEVLVLHLKRFTYSRYSRDKIETSVKFPLKRLSLESIMTQTPGHDQIVYYDLFGISNHMGGLGGGHYIAHTKNWDTGLWYEKNDGIVTQVDEGRIESLGRSSYVLFFQKSRQQ